MAEEPAEPAEEEIDVFESGGDLQIFDDPAVANDTGAKSDRSVVSELEDGKPFDKWHNREYQDYYKQL